jgi:hypothetical protein
LEPSSAKREQARRSRHAPCDRHPASASGFGSRPATKGGVGPRSGRPAAIGGQCGRLQRAPTTHVFTLVARTANLHGFDASHDRYALGKRLTPLSTRSIVYSSLSVFYRSNWKGRSTCRGLGSPSEPVSSSLSRLFFLPSRTRLGRMPDKYSLLLSTGNVSLNWSAILHRLFWPKRSSYWLRHPTGNASGRYLDRRR